MMGTLTDIDRAKARSLLRAAHALQTAAYEILDEEVGYQQVVDALVKIHGTIGARVREFQKSAADRRRQDEEFISGGLDHF